MYRVLSKSYPNVRCELDFNNPFQLLVATVLSAQCTDKRVNQTTPALFKKYKSIKKMASADQEDIEKLIKSTQRIDVHYINQQLKKYLGDYLGVEFGSPQHGHLELYVINSPTYIGRDEWIKTVFNKEIKKEFKKIPNAEDTISSLKFIPDDSRMSANIKIGWKRSSRWTNQSAVGDKAQEMIKNMGYNTSVLRVQT